MVISMKKNVQKNGFLRALLLHKTHKYYLMIYFDLELLKNR